MMNVREWALPVYTILMQLATGTLFILWMIRSFNQKRLSSLDLTRILRRPVLIVFLTILVAILGSHFHLSQPLVSFLALLNVRSSWLSREVLFTILLLITTTLLVGEVWIRDGKPRWMTILGWATILLGSASIYCMSSIYLLPTQSPWNNWITVMLFFSSGLLLGAISAAGLLLMDAIFSQTLEPELADARLEILKRSFGALARLVAGVLILILVLNAVQIFEISNGDTLARASLTLLLGLYRPLLIVRILALLAAAASLYLAVIWLKKKARPLIELVTPVYAACLLAMVAEILGRFLFYAIHVRLGI